MRAVVPLLTLAGREWYTVIRTVNTVDERKKMVERIEVPTSQLAEILVGIQTSIIGVGEPDVGVGQILTFASSDHKASVEAKVRDIRMLSADALTLGDALASGSTSVEEMMEKLSPLPAPDSDVYVAAFSLVEA